MLALGVARLGVGLPLMRDHLEAAQPRRPLSLKCFLDAIAGRQPIDWQWAKMRDTAALLNPVEKSQIFFLKASPVPCFQLAETVPNRLG